VSGQQHVPAALYPGDRPSTHCTGGWVGSRVGLDGWKISPPSGIRSPDRPARSQSLYPISYPAHCMIKCLDNFPFTVRLEASITWLNGKVLGQLGIYNDTRSLYHLASRRETRRYLITGKYTLKTKVQSRNEIRNTRPALYIVKHRTKGSKDFLRTFLCTVFIHICTQNR
jgi:hypothetical protein